ncbi:MAG: sodium/solute symporter [Clostridia bacterium]|nr:sodium/solute symporter [Clostridia bacterium]
MLVKLLFLVVFFAITVGVGIYCRKNATDVNGFVLGGRSVGPWLTAFAFGTSYFSAVIFVGYAGQFGWKFGMASTWIGLGNAFIGSLLAWSILGRRTRILTQALDSKTMPDFFGLRFKSNALKTVASVIVFIFLIPYTASLFNGLSRLFTAAFPGVDYAWCVVIMAVLTAVYVIVGGYMATAINDFIQGIIMLGGIAAVILLVLNQNGGLQGSVEALSQVTTDATADQAGAFTSFFGPEPLSLLFVVILTSLGTWGLPQMVGKFYSIKSESDINKGTIISTIFAIVVAGGCYFLGGFGRLFGTPANAAAPEGGFDSIIPAMVQALNSDVMFGIVLILVLSASMSTLSSLVLTSSSTITLDLIVPAVKKGVSEKKKLFIMRIFVAFFIIVSATIAIIQANPELNIGFIAQLMGVSWGALAGAFLAPFLYGLYWKKTTRAAVLVSFIFGAGFMTANFICQLAGITFISPFMASPINSGVVAMLAGLVIVPVVSLFTPMMNKADVDKMFSCYDEKITVSVKKSLQYK